jgi:hypothetical protein
VVRIIIARLWKKRVPRGRFIEKYYDEYAWNSKLIKKLTIKDHMIIPSVERAITAKTAHSQSLPPLVI